MKSKGYYPPKNAQELLQRYNCGERYFGFVELDNENYNLQNVLLEGVDFSMSFITADFRGANLKQANFHQANIKTCDFRGANLQGANFGNALLDSTLFDGADLRGSNFVGASYHNYTFKEDKKPWW